MLFRELSSARRSRPFDHGGSAGNAPRGNIPAHAKMQLYFPGRPHHVKDPSAKRVATHFSLSPAEVNSAMAVKTSAAMKVVFRAKTKPAGSSVVKLAALMPL